MLTDDGERNPATMATALRNLPQQRLPSETVVPGLLDGRDNVVKLTKQWISRRQTGLVGALEDDSDDVMMPGGT